MIHEKDSDPRCAIASISHFSSFSITFFLYSFSVDLLLNKSKHHAGMCCIQDFCGGECNIWEGSMLFNNPN